MPNLRLVKILKLEILPHPPEVIDVDPEIIAVMKRRLAEAKIAEEKQALKKQFQIPLRFLSQSSDLYNRSEDLEP